MEYELFGKNRLSEVVQIVFRMPNLVSRKATTWDKLMVGPMKDLKMTDVRDQWARNFLRDRTWSVDNG